MGVNGILSQEYWREEEINHFLGRYARGEMSKSLFRAHILNIVDNGLEFISIMDFAGAL